MAKDKVLLVDDNVEFTTALAERMEVRGFSVDTAESGATALDKIKDAAYDAVILDLAMPGMDGIETMKRLLEKQPDLQIILLTGYASVEKGIEAMKLGAVDFLEKPADLKKLVSKVKEARTQKMLLVQKQLEDKITKILREKGW